MAVYPITLSNANLGTAVLTVGVVVYSIFHRYEPSQTNALVLLLLLVPAALSGLALCSISGLAVAIISPTAYWSILGLLTLIYRISPFHPLAKYPGPLLHKISKLPMVQKARQGYLHKHYQELHEKYGDFVRVGPNDLSYCNVNGVQATLGRSGLPKGPWYAAGSSGTIIYETDRAWHAVLRKTWNKAFSGEALHEYEPIIIRRSAELVAELDKRVLNEVDISKWMDYFSFDVMAEIVFSSPFRMMKEGADVQQYGNAINLSMSRTVFIAQIPWATSYIRGLIGKLYKNELTIVPISIKMVGQRLKAGSVTKDLFYHLSVDMEKNLDLPHLTKECSIAIVAGSDTTATVMSNLWYYLLRNPSCFNRLQKEVDATFSRDEEPVDQGKLSRMTYLNACLNEVMRLQPPVLSGSQRAVSGGSGGIVLSDYFVPEGTNIVVPTYVLHRDSRYFSPYTEEFWPDRWLSPEDRMDKEDTSKPFTAHEQIILEHGAFMPFSTGPRVCVGKPLAWSEMRMAVSSVMQRFDMKAVDGFDLRDWEHNLKDQYVMKKGSLPVRLTRRVR